LTLDNSRIDKAFWLVGYVLPIPEDDAKKKALEAIVGGKLETIIPQFMKMLSLMIKENHETSEMWIQFFTQLLRYINGESDDMPEVNIPQEEINKIWTIYDINHKEK